MLFILIFYQIGGLGGWIWKTKVNFRMVESHDKPRIISQVVYIKASPFMRCSIIRQLWHIGICHALSLRQVHTTYLQLYSWIQLERS